MKNRMEDIDHLTKDVLWNTIIDVINELKKQGYETWQISEYLDHNLDLGHIYITNQL